MNKKVTQLETENGILQNQSRVLAETIHQLESEVGNNRTKTINEILSTGGRLGQAELRHRS